MQSPPCSATFARRLRADNDDAGRRSARERPRGTGQLDYATRAQAGMTLTPMNRPIQLNENDVAV
jgi:hypothetical protein